MLPLFPREEWGDTMIGHAHHALRFLAGTVIVTAITLCWTFKTVSYSQTLDLQERCAAQAKAAFVDWSNDDKLSAQKLGGSEAFPSDYQNHFNTKLGKCLMLIEATHTLGKQISNTVMLTDANERRTYAYYLWISREAKKYWEVAPTSCELIPTLSQKTNCTTREEFDAFVAKYMEE